MASAAKLGFEAYCRQDYIGADYGLVDCSTGSPLPDYWSLLLWTWLMCDATANLLQNSLLLSAPDALCVTGVPRC